ncbi:ATP-binding protein [Streptomyces sp. NPDC059017]|uniref:ATP-binding protein n=1 Tax=Streptomyces sp. NPDC059017 TaxID=3346700 RepID=UPI0036C6D83F
MKSQISTPGWTPHTPPTPLRFTRLLSATPRGARLARLLAVRQLTEWGRPSTSTATESAALVVAELAANAVTHARVRGRCFRLTLTIETPDTLRVEVTDPRGDRPLQPRTAATATAAAPDPTAESGRGLLLVDALATRWGSAPYPPSGKTVWACLPLAARDDDLYETDRPQTDTGRGQRPERWGEF